MVLSRELAFDKAPLDGMRRRHRVIVARMLRQARKHWRATGQQQRLQGFRRGWLDSKRATREVKL